MTFIDNYSPDPAFCLASEEYLMEGHPSGEVLMLWSPASPAAVIGKNQNPYEEVSPLLCQERNVGVYRRTSGGGTVFHGPGNLNFTFVRPRSGDTGYGVFLGPVRDFLVSRGIPAEIAGNMITAGGLKISGNAQAYSGDTMLHHGTLLFSADLGLLGEITGKRRDAIESKAVKSSPHPVGNISDYTGMTFSEFRHELGRALSGGIPSRDFTGEEAAKIEKLAECRYRTWEWNWGRSPAFTFRKDGISVRCEKGRVASMTVRGQAVPELEGMPLIYEKVRDALVSVMGEFGAFCAGEIFR